MKNYNCEYKRFLNLCMNIVLNIVEKTVMYPQHDHSHKKRKDSLEGSLDRVLFAAEVEFPKIIVPRLPQNLSNVKIECARILKQLYSLYDQFLAALT